MAWHPCGLVERLLSEGIGIIVSKQCVKAIPLTSTNDVSLGIFKVACTAAHRLPVYTRAKELC